jgi:hypothetical protein
MYFNTEVHHELYLGTDAELYHNIYVYDLELKFMMGCIQVLKFTANCTSVLKCLAARYILLYRFHHSLHLQCIHPYIEQSPNF